MHSTTYNDTCVIICAKPKSIKISAIPVFISTMLSVNGLWPNCNVMFNFSSHAKFYSGEGENSKMFLIKKVHVCCCSCSFGFIS